MTLEETLEALRGLAPPVPRRGGKAEAISEAGAATSLADLRRLQRRIRVDHVLAQRLWQVGRRDARRLAVLVADPERITSARLDTWARTLDEPMLAELLALHLVRRTPFVRRKAERWARARSPWTAEAGWRLVAFLAEEDARLPDRFFVPLLDLLRRSLPRQPVERGAVLQQALAAIAARGPALALRADRVRKAIERNGYAGSRAPRSSTRRQASTTAAS